LRAVKSLKLNQGIRILPADKGTVILDETQYRDKINILLKSGVYEALHRDPTAKIERKIQHILAKHRMALPTEVKHKLTPYYSKPPYLYGLQIIHKPDILLRLIVSSIGSPCYALAGFLHKILNRLAGRADSFMKNSGNFIELLKPVDLQKQDILTSFDMVSLFTNVPVDEALQVIRGRL
jgi:hypothetical protein